jgi:hypothetical protein
MTKLETAAKAIVAAALIAAWAQPARADYHIFSPDELDQGELELEHNGSAAFDHDPAADGETSYTTEIGTGLFGFWHPEVEFQFGRDPGPDQPTKMQAAVFENTFMLTEPGENWADFGMYAEYALSTLRTDPDTVTAGPLIEKDIGRTTETVNLFLTKEIGANQDSHGYDFSYAAQSRWNLWRALSPAIEIYGDAGPLDAVPKFADQQFLVGPVGIGQMPLGTIGKIKYELGWLFGATPASANGTLRWRLEFEIPF